MQWFLKEPPDLSLLRKTPKQTNKKNKHTDKVRTVSLLEKVGDGA
jgi:hypothetical protein